MPIPIHDNTSLLNALKTKAQALPDRGSSGGSGSGVDVSGVTATAPDVIYGKVIVDSGGNPVVGSMPNNGAVSQTVTSNGDVSIAQGYHNGSGKITVNVPSESSIPTDGTAAASDVRSGETFYAGGVKKTGTMPTVTLGTPTITVSSAGKITASVSQASSGYVASATKTATQNLTTRAATTITPGTSKKTACASGVYTTGAITVAGDTNLIADNIKSGVSIFGVTGTYGGGSSDFRVLVKEDVNLIDPMQSFYVNNVFNTISSIDDILSISVFRFETEAGAYNTTVYYAYYSVPANINLCVYGTTNNLSGEQNAGIEYIKSGSNLLVRTSSYRFEGMYSFAIAYQA